MLILLALLAAASAYLPSPTSLRPHLDVAIELEHGVALTRADLAAVERELTTIWAPFADLHVSGPSSAVPAHATEVVRLLVSTRTLPGHDHGGLGWIEFIDGEPQQTLTISTTALQRMIANGKWNDRPLATLAPRASQLAMQHGLARAASHEVGHYLLRSTAHSRTGLMRAVVTLDDLMDGRRAMTRLDAEQIARLHDPSRLVARRDTAGMAQPLDPTIGR